MDETVLLSCLRNMLLLLFVCENDMFLMKIYDNGLRNIQQNKNWKLDNQNFNQRTSLNKVENGRFIPKRLFIVKSRCLKCEIDRAQIMETNFKYSCLCVVPHFMNESRVSFHKKQPIRTAA